MSWYIQKIGKRDAVLKEITLDDNLPSAIRNAIISVLQAEPTAPSGVRVEGAGHTYTGANSSYSSIARLEVQPFQFVE